MTDDLVKVRGYWVVDRAEERGPPIDRKTVLAVILAALILWGGFALVVLAIVALRHWLGW